MLPFIETTGLVRPMSLIQPWFRTAKTSPNRIFRLPCPLFPGGFSPPFCFLDLSVKKSGGQGANLSMNGAIKPLP